MRALLHVMGMIGLLLLELCADANVLIHTCVRSTRTHAHTHTPTCARAHTHTQSKSLGGMMT
jgi:hypothetical protein